MTVTDLALTATFNFRDLGGLPGADGRTVRHGVVYRADGLHRLGEDDLDRVAASGMRTVIDLRTLAELETAPSVRHEGFEVVHLPVIERVWMEDEALLAGANDAVTFLRARYAEMLVEGGPALACAVRILAEPARRPAVFHCSAGKDRTGVLAALLLDVLGVPPERIAEDYARSAAAMERLSEWIAANHPEAADMMAQQPAALMACPPEAMRAFLDDLTDRHGGAEGYLLAHGIESEIVLSLRGQLLESA